MFVQLEDPAVDRDRLVGAAFPHEGIAELDVRLTEARRILHLRGHLDPRLVASNGGRFGLNQFAGHLPGVQQLALLLITGKGLLEPSDATGTIAVFEQRVGGDPLAERVVKRHPFGQLRRRRRKRGTGLKEDQRCATLGARIPSGLQSLARGIERGDFETIERRHLAGLGGCTRDVYEPVQHHAWRERSVELHIGTVLFQPFD